jgi:hypothetical protein
MRVLSRSYLPLSFDLYLSLLISTRPRTPTRTYVITTTLHEPDNQMTSLSIVMQMCMAFGMLIYRIDRNTRPTKPGSGYFIPFACIRDQFSVSTCPLSKDMIGMLPQRKFVLFVRYQPWMGVIPGKLIILCFDCSVGLFH